MATPNQIFNIIDIPIMTPQTPLKFFMRQLCHNKPSVLFTMSACSIGDLNAWLSELVEYRIYTKLAIQNLQMNLNTQA